MTKWLRLIRPGDWTKNVFVLLALLFWLPNHLRSQSGVDLTSSLATVLVATALAFVAFCAAASGFYCVNDALDSARDRLHPVKKHRPVAAGAISRGQAIVLGAGLILLGITAGFAASKGAGACLVAYAVLQAAYNLGLKRVIFVDVVTLAIGFSLRAACGALAIGVQVSPWLLACVFSVTLYLGFIKRLCDLSSARRVNNSEWRSPAGYDNPFELNWLLGMSGTLTVLMYLLYALSTHAQRIFGVRAVGLALLTPLVLIVVHRFFRRANEGLSDSPLAALIEDRAVAIAIALFVLGAGVTLYVPEAQTVLGKLFLTEPIPVMSAPGSPSTPTS
ncbi:MAG: UbiA prenyltransferase family protein [Phycisphaerae bacterium]|nr:UbiA prenyltransferase family protein [Phycisphaerae bacterium]